MNIKLVKEAQIGDISVTLKPNGMGNCSKCGLVTPCLKSKAGGQEKTLKEWLAFHIQLFHDKKD